MNIPVNRNGVVDQNTNYSDAMILHLLDIIIKLAMKSLQKKKFENTGIMWFIVGYCIALWDILECVKAFYTIETIQLQKNCQMHSNNRCLGASTASGAVNWLKNFLALSLSHA